MEIANQKLKRSCAVVLMLGALGCTHATQHTTTPPSPATFLAEHGVLYRVDSTGRTALLALDSTKAPAGVTIAPSQWTPAPGSTFRVAADSFRFVAAAPAADWVAWETAGSVHDLLGIVPANGGKIKILDFFFDSSGRALMWAPAGRYLAVLYDPPSGMAELRVYDAHTGNKLNTPWSGEVVSARWSGPTTVAVKTVSGDYQVDVSRL